MMQPRPGVAQWVARRSFEGAGPPCAGTPTVPPVRKLPLKKLGSRALVPLPRGVTIALCGLVLVAIALVDRQAASLAASTGDGGLVDVAATIDLTVGASLIAWWMLGRDFEWSYWALVPLYFASLALAGAALPAGHRGALRIAHLAAAPLELLTFAFLVGKVRVGRRTFRADPTETGSWDAQAALQHATAEALGPGRFAEVLAYEMSVLYYALGARSPRAEAAAPGFTYHRKTAYGAIVFALLMATAVEVAAVHLLVSLWSHRVAWILTGLGIYGALWVYGDWRACRLRPITVEARRIRIRFGLRWRVDVPLEAVTALRAPTAEERATKRALDLRLALPGATLQVLELDRPIPAQGIYGLRRTVRTLGLGLDEPTLLRAALTEAGADIDTEREHR